MLEIAEADLRAAYKNTVKQDRYGAVDAVKAKVLTALFPEGAEPRFDKDKVGSVFKDLQAKIVRWNILDTGSRIDGRDLKTVRPIVLRSRGAAARARLGALHARRDAGARRRHARHRRGRADDRQPGGHLQGELHAALQFPALFRRRGGPHGLARPPRDRPRQACLARHPSDPAGEPRVPLHDARRLRDHRVRTARPRWRRYAARRWR